MTRKALESFLGALDPGKSAQVDTAGIEDAFGARCSADAHQLFSYLGERSSYGDFRALGDISTFAEPNTFIDLLRRPMHLLGAFAGALPIGEDAGGRTYFLHVGIADEVGLYDPGLGELAHLAGSLESFAGLNHAGELFEAYVEEHDIDVEALIDGRASLPSPKSSELSDLLDTLRSSVRLSDEFDVYSDLTEAFCALGGSFESSPKTTMSSDIERTWWLAQAFEQRCLRAGDLEKVLVAPKVLTKVGDALYALWRAFFMNESESLSALLLECRTHDAALVRDAAATIVSLEKGDLPQFGYLRAARDLAQGATMPEAAAMIPTSEHPLLVDDQVEAIRKLVGKLRVQPTLATCWDQLAYHLFGHERWAEMMEAAKASIAIEARNYYPWMQLGIALSHLDDHCGALRAFDTGLALEGNNPNLWYNKAGSLVELGEYEDAISHLELVPPAGRRDAILSIGDFRILEGNSRYDTLMAEVSEL